MTVCMRHSKSRNFKTLVHVPRFVEVQLFLAGRVDDGGTQCFVASFWEEGGKKEDLSGTVGKIRACISP